MTKQRNNNRRRDRKPSVNSPTDDIDVMRHMRRNKRRLRRKQRQFIEAVEQQRPNINPDELLQDFELISQRSTARMVRLAMRSLALTSAASYAAEELNNRLNAEDMNFRLDEIDVFAKRLVRLHILRLMLRVFHVPKMLCQQIVNLQIGKDFGSDAPARMPMRLPISPGQLPPASRKNNVKIPGTRNPFLSQAKAPPAGKGAQSRRQNPARPKHW